ncbi:MAG: glycogen debranching enzyme N-terminal domain-containing protein [Candidatus Diapherotrites archaeon]|nr:glycogen debranching enzyme N-terminal domain-containing protein [Candidatus Diapherotrites archaeon]
MPRDSFKVDVKKTGLEKSLELEWLETNGLGGYSSSTVVGANTRKYHGLLVAAMEPPVERWVLLSKLEETIETNGEKTDLSTNIYPDAVYPRGFKAMDGFSRDSFSKEPFPTFVFSVGKTTVKKTVFLFRHENTVAVLYEVKNAPKNTVFTVRPLVNFRGFHDITSFDSCRFDVFQQAFEKGTFAASSMQNAPKLFLSSDKLSFSEKGEWYFNAVYPKERGRGYKFTEDNFCLGEFSVQLNGKSKKTVRFFVLAKAMQPSETLKKCRKEVALDLKKIDSLMARERQRRKDIVKSARKQCRVKNNRFFDSLVLASDQFIVKRNSNGGSSIIAGYHWFADWGRDAMISLNGLALCTGRFEEAKQILLAFARHHKNGVLPNRFVDRTNSAQYNSVDVSLWFFVAVGQLLKRTKDKKFVKQRLWPVMKKTIDAYKNGLAENISMDLDGLVKTGEGTQLTWMDAQPPQGKPVTPRSGKPVEIQALWFNALMIASGLAEEFEKTGTLGKKYFRLASKVRESFNEKFWNEKEQCLFDVVDVGGGTRVLAKVRPNQLIATGLEFDLLDPEKLDKVVLKAETELLSSKGLLTLRRKNPDFKAHYEGDVNLRDSAYHEGTIWPWLAGPYVKSLLKSSCCSKTVLLKTKSFLEGFAPELERGGLGTIPEIFEADSLMQKGCIAQAWSVAQLLEVYCLVLEKIRESK